MATALAALMSLPAITLAPHATPIDEAPRLAAALSAQPPRLLIKRDDLLSFGCGGNKVRKLQTVLAEARAAGADTLITCGGVQSNHARATAAAGAALGMGVVLVLNRPSSTLGFGDARPSPVGDGGPTGNARLDVLFGADVRVVASREDRAPAMETIADELRAAGRTPFIIPLGASNVTGALGFARGIAELASAGVKPDVIVHASSSAGTQAGVIAGCALFGLKTRVVGVSADETADRLATAVRGLLEAMADRLGSKPASLGLDREVEVDDSQVGLGYGVPTRASEEALELTARREGTLLDPVYTAKAMAGLMARVRNGEIGSGQTVLFWHTGGQAGYFA